MKNKQRISLQPAYLLHRRAFRDASVIADFLTRDFGRVALVARGAGKGSRRCLDAFRPLLLSYTSRGELGSLTAVEADGKATPLGQQEVLCAYYANELLLRMTQQSAPAPELFAEYGSLLSALASANSSVRALRLFEKRLLDELGYGADLTREWQSGRPLDPTLRYRVAPEQGPELVARMSPANEDDVFAGASLLSLAHEELTDKVSLRDARRLLRMSLDYYLDGKPLKSREVMRAMQRRIVAVPGRMSGSEA